jgi:hypothetical protein
MSVHPDSYEAVWAGVRRRPDHASLLDLTDPPGSWDRPKTDWTAAEISLVGAGIGTNLLSPDQVAGLRRRTEEEHRNGFVATAGIDVRTLIDAGV